MKPILACLVVMACGKAADTSGTGSSHRAQLKTADDLRTLIALSSKPDLDHMTFPDAERDALKARFAADPKQFLVATSDPTPDTYVALATFPGKVIIVQGMTDMTVEQAKAIATWPGDTLVLDTPVVTPDVAAALASWPGNSLHLDKLTDLGTKAAASLATFHGKTLAVGHPDMEAGAAEQLAKYKGAVAISLTHDVQPIEGTLPPPTESDADLAILGRISKAIDNGDIAAVTEFLKGGGNVDMNERGTTLLMEATNLKQLEVAKILVAAKAQVNAKSQVGVGPLYYAIDPNEFGGPNPRNTPATVLALVKLLVDAGANINAPGAGDLWVSPIAQAAKRGDPELVKYLLDKGATDKTTALIEAIDAGDAAITTQLVAAGADVNPKNPKMGMIPLTQAVQQGAMEIEMAKTMKKPDPSKQRLATLDAVLAAKPDLAAQDERGETALDAAVNGGNAEILAHLLAAKPDLAAKDGKGRTVLSYLADNHRLEQPQLVAMAKALRAAGAKADADAAEIATKRKFPALAAVLR